MFVRVAAGFKAKRDYSFNMNSHYSVKYLFSGM